MKFRTSIQRFIRVALTSLFITAGLVVIPRTTLAVDTEEAHYNAVVSLYNAGQWQAALSKIDEREKQALNDATAHPLPLCARLGPGKGRP